MCLCVYTNHSLSGVPYSGGGGGGGGGGMGVWGGGERQQDEAIFASLFPVNGKVSGIYSDVHIPTVSPLLMMHVDIKLRTLGCI